MGVVHRPDIPVLWMDQLVPVVEQLEELGRLGNELERHAEDEGVLERARHARLAEALDGERRQ